MLDRLISMTSDPGASCAAYRRRRRTRNRGLAVLPLLLALAIPGAIKADVATTERVSVASDGTEGDGISNSPAVSADGRYVAFASFANNLVPGDTTFGFDAFVHDRQTGATERVSVASDGTQSDGFLTLGVAISADGRYVAFDSDATNLVPGDTNGTFDIFVRDRETGTTERVSVASDGTEGNSISQAPAISADGRYVVFDSAADNLVAGDANGFRDIFVHDRETGETVRVSVASDGTEGNQDSTFPAISADGRFVAFGSRADGLVPGDANGVEDVFVHDRDTGTTERVSLASDDGEGNGQSRVPAISADGLHVAFESDADNLVADDTNGRSDVFVHDRQTGATERVSIASDATAGNLNSSQASLSADGRRVAFASDADNLVPGDANGARDLFVHDRDTGITERVSVAADGAEADASTSVGVISADGLHFAFETSASLVPGDTNSFNDIFVRVRFDLESAPEPLDFGPVSIGQTDGPSSVTITNVLRPEITVTEITAPQVPFAAAEGTCGPLPFTLLLGESCELAFTFTPTAAEQYEGTVTLTSDAPEGPHTVTLRGLGVADVLDITPAVLDFGGVVLDHTAGPASVTLSNTSPEAIEISALAAPSAPFAAAGGTCGPAPFTLAPFASCTLDYSFTPETTGAFSDFIEVTHDAPSGPGGFTLEGEGLLRELSVDPTFLKFGPVPTGGSGGPLGVTLTNPGDVDVTFNEISDPGEPFELTEWTCGDVLPPGSSCTLAYTFNPTEPGQASAAVSIRTDAPSSPDIVTLHGSGEEAAVLEFEPRRMESTLAPGQTETRPLTIANLGSGPSLGWDLATEAVAAEEATLTHSESIFISALNNIACGTPFTTLENHYFRTFTLADLFIFDFEVTEVTFGVRSANPGRLNTVPVTVNLHTLGGEFLFENLTLLGSTTVELTPEANGTLVTVPMTVTAPAGATLVVEIATPNLDEFGGGFRHGQNDRGEGAPSYIAAPDCDVPEPVPFADIGFPDVHLVMSVTGVASGFDCSLPDWASVNPLSGTVPAGAEQQVDVAFDAGALPHGDYRAPLCLTTNDPAQLRTLVPLAMTVGVGELTFDPPSLDFGDVELGDTGTRTATLTNTGDAEISGLTLGGLPDGGFEADTGLCAAGLPAGGSCQISVTFTPTAPGPSSATLQASADDGVVADLSLAGNGVAGEGFTAIDLAVDPPGLTPEANGVLEPGEAVDVAPSWRNDGGFAASLAGAASSFTGPEGASYTVDLAAADYGLIEPAATASCLDTEVCYRLALDDPAARPAAHWDAAFEETLDDDAGTVETWTLHIGGSFTDVPMTSPFYPSIETLLHSGVTGGCADGAYCPGGVVSRSQLPVFVLRALEGPDYVPPACDEDAEAFSDVPASSPFCGWIEELHRRNVVSGCGDGAYCPTDPVTRAQMAIFLLKTLEGDGYTPIECTARFDDVPCSSLFADWIEDLAAREITGGCSETGFCPADPVSRAQMATFVTRAFGLTLYGP